MMTVTMIIQNHDVLPGLLMVVVYVRHLGLRSLFGLDITVFNGANPTVVAL